LQAILANTEKYIMNNKTPGDLIAIAGRFTSTGAAADVQPFGSGNINDTFLVTPDSGNERKFILQRLNTHVFKRPELVMRNMRRVTEHIEARLRNISIEGRRWETPRVLMTRDGQDHFIDSLGSFWRAITFIESTESSDTIQSVAHAEEVGFALGMFHNLVSDLPPAILSDTLEGFHITPRYLSHYDDVMVRMQSARSPETEYCIQFIGKRRALAHMLEDAKAQGKIHMRTMHGDPKINNVLIDTATHRAVCMIDLDTVKPGLVHYDIGDSLRSACNPLGEEVEQWESVSFEPELCRAILRGYLSQARSFLTAADYEYLFDAGRLIAFELGLRFFTDHLEGNVYFKARYEGHNLLRALCQFRLAESIESQEAVIRALIKDFR
jgi:Ser/Thr protein kinase RdoA (MazF antagonist)